jgi:hypothetical protein
MTAFYDQKRVQLKKISSLYRAHHEGLFSSSPERKQPAPKKPRKLTLVFGFLYPVNGLEERAPSS